MILVTLATMLAGCQTMEMIGASGTAPRSLPGQTSAAAPQDGVDLTTPKVYLMRGLARTVSEGVDHLSAKLTARGYRASVHGYGDWQEIANAILSDRRRSGGASRAVVVGHSLGANSVVALVNTLAGRNVEVDLAVTFDPTVDLQVNGGVRRFINFYQSDNGWGRVVRASAAMESRVENTDLKVMVHLTHFTIDRDAQIHERVMTAIARIVAHPPAPDTR
ncbi:hypothetical protein ACJ4V0_16935 [Phreatobacter sp. HK31-P]